MPSSIPGPCRSEVSCAGDDGACGVITALWEAEAGDGIQHQHGLQVKYCSMKQRNKTLKLLETKFYDIYPVSLRNMQRGGQSDRNGFK